MKAILSLLISCLVLSVSGQDCYDQFDYHRAITLTPPDGLSQIAGATFAIPFDSKTLFEQGKIAADGSDLRITDEVCSPLPFYVQGISERDSNIIYVALPDIPQSGLTIQLYYGSTETELSVIDGESVFEFFDDFEDGVVDYDKWEVIGDVETLTEENGELRFTGSFGTGGVFKYVTPLVGFETPMTYDFTANSNSSQHYGMADITDIQRIGLRHLTGDQTNDTLDVIVYLADTLNGGFSPGILYPYVIVPRNDLNIISMSAFIDSEQKLNFTRFENHSSKTYNLDTLTVEVYDFDALRPFFSSFGQAITMEYVGIRNTPEALPQITLGDEIEINSTSIDEYLLDKSIRVFPNPVSEILNLMPLDGVPRGIELIDMNGRTVLRSVFTPQLDVSGVGAGHYTIKFIYGPGVITFSEVIIR